MNSQLKKGSNTVLPAAQLTLEVSYPGSIEVDPIILSLYDVGGDLQVRNDKDMTFFNEPVSQDGAVQLTSATSVQFDLTRANSGVQKFLVAGAIDGGTAQDIAGLTTRVSCGAETYDLPMTGVDTETLVILAEVYLYQGNWKLRNVSQGYVNGLRGLAESYGITVQDEPAAAPPVPASSPAAPTPSAIDLRKQEWLKQPPASASKIDLRKHEVAITLDKHNILGELARVCLVLDYSGSIRHLFRPQRMPDGRKRSVVQDVIERLVPVAARLDDDGTLEMFTFGTRSTRMPSVDEHSVEGYLDRKDIKRLLDSVGHDNVEPLVMQDVINKYLREEPSHLPTLVLFISDGGVGLGPRGYHGNINEEIKQLLRDSSGSPIFWQFVGLGNNGYGPLEALDQLGGRVIDNAGFFAVDDIQWLSDTELYNRLLTEYPAWYKLAKQHGIIH